MCLIKTGFLVVLMFMSQIVVGQKVALVLSGGGAKGLAHVGVIRALEENNIPIDYIVGTSMGGVIGGFYAAGYSADEIEQIATSEDLQKWIRGEPDEEYKIHYNIDMSDPSWVSLKLTLDSGFSASFNASIADDHVLNMVLAEKMARATSIAQEDFDQLFVPFRTTGSEIFTQQEKILKSGDLYQSVRASMAVPFFYRPIKINNQYLFDGGLYNNFPAELAQNEFNPDIIIGVNVASKQLLEYPYENDSDIINESILFAILDKTNPTEIDSTDVFIDVQLDGYSAGDFKYAREIVKSGYVSTNNKMTEILEKIERRIPASALKKRRDEFAARESEIVFDSLFIDGFGQKQLNYLYSQFDLSDSMTFDDIKSGYYKVISDDYFASIIPGYRVKGDQNVFSLTGNPNPKLRGKIGGSLTTRSISQLYLGFDYKSLKRRLSHYSLRLFTGRFYQSALLNVNIRFPGKSGISLIPQIVYNQWDFINTSDFLIRDANPTILNQQDYKSGLRLEFPMTKKNKLFLEGSYLNYSGEYSNNSTFVSSDVLDAIDLSGGTFKIGFYGNSLNHKQYAYRGSMVAADFQYFTLQEDYTPGSTSVLDAFQNKSHQWFNAKLRGENYHYISDKYSLGYSYDFNYSSLPALGTERASEILLPAFYPLQDSKTLLLENFRGRKYVGLGVKNVLHIANSLQFRIEGYAFNSFEKLVAQSDQTTQFEPVTFNLKLAGSAAIVFQSLIGPISLSGNYYDDSENRWGVLLHFGYLLFNKHALE